MTANPMPSDDDDTPADPLGIDPELIKELDAKSKEIINEAVAAGTIGIGELLDPEQIFPSPNNPMGVARRLLKDWTHNGLSTLLHWRGAWMRWQFTHWIEVEEGAIRSQVYARLEKAVFFLNPKKDKKSEEPKTLADLAGPLASEPSQGRRRHGGHERVRAPGRVDRHAQLGTRPACQAS